MGETSQQELENKSSRLDARRSVDSPSLVGSGRNTVVGVRAANPDASVGEESRGRVVKALNLARREVRREARAGFGDRVVEGWAQDGVASVGSTDGIGNVAVAGDTCSGTSVSGRAKELEPTSTYRFWRR